MSAKNKGGRPNSITKEVAETIFAHMADGLSLRQVCKLPGMPDKATVLRMAVSTNDDHKWFRDQYAHAMQLRAQGWADEILDIADDGSNDWYEYEMRSGNEDDDPETIKKPDTEHINRSRLRIDSRKWILSKLMPKEYGDKQQIEHSGKDGQPLIPVMNIGKKPKN